MPHYGEGRVLNTSVTEVDHSSMSATIRFHTHLRGVANPLRAVRWFGRFLRIWKILVDSQKDKCNKLGL